MDPHVYMGANEKVIRRFKYQQILGWLIVIAIFIFLGKMVWENWAQVKQASFTFRPITLLLSTFIFAFSYFIQIWAWYLITLKLGIALSFSETLESWFYSQLGKNLPGKVWLLLGRFYFYESKGKSKKTISVALFIETATVLIAAGLLCLVGLFFFKEVRSFYFRGQLGWLVLLFFLACACLHPWILQRIINWILKLFKKEPLFLSIAYTDILWILLISLLSWAAGGIGFLFFRCIRISCFLIPYSISGRSIGHRKHIGFSCCFCSQWIRRKRRGFSLSPFICDAGISGCHCLCPHSHLDNAD